MHTDPLSNPRFLQITLLYYFRSSGPAASILPDLTPQPQHELQFYIKISHRTWAPIAHKVKSSKWASIVHKNYFHERIAIYVRNCYQLFRRYLSSSQKCTWYPSSINIASNSDSIFYFHWHIVKSNLHGVTEQLFVSSEAYVWFAHVKNNSRKYIVTSASPRSYITQFPTIIYGRFSFQIEYKRNLLKKTVKWIENSR